MDLGQFIAKVAGMSMAIEHETHKALERAAKVVEAEAKREIGHYQSAAGPFAAWAELADSTKADRVAQGFTENDPLLRTGDLRDSITHAVGHHEAVIGSNSDVAVYQELGTRRIPPRSFLGGAMVRKSDTVAAILGAGVVKGLVGEQVVNRYLPIPD